MRRRNALFALWITCVATLFGAVPCLAEEPDPASYADPTIGNIAQLLVPTYPTFQQPNQMLRMYPIRKDWTFDQVQYFPLQIMRHRGKGILPMRVISGDVTPGSWKKRMAYDHDLEIVHPWLYETYLVEDDITVAFTPGRKSAIWRYTFAEGTRGNILISGVDMEIKPRDATTVNIHARVTKTSKNPELEPTTMSVWIRAEVTDQEGRPARGLQIQPGDNRLTIEVGEGAPRTILLKYALSYINQKQARKNFDAELAGTSFDALAAQGRAAWNSMLGKVRVKGGTEAQNRTFYTALYRTHERMIDITEDGRYYSGYDQAIHESDRPFYVDDWVWDTYRATHPLRSILTPGMQQDMLHSYVEMYRQSGWMPTFPQVFRNHACMNAYHSSVLFLDAWRKGLRNFDMETAYEGVRKTVTEGTWIPWRQGSKATALDELMKELGFMPALHPGEKETEPLVDGFERRQSVAISLGRSFDMWVLSELAGELGKQEDQTRFANISDQYKLLWSDEHRMFMPRDSKGEWIDIDPKSAGGRGYRDYYDENNGWTYAWAVPHDIPGLMELLGGREATCERLDQLFREPLGMSKTVFYVDGGNSTGMVGQFSMGNEPSFHIPYLYNYCGQPWRTQQRTRFLLDLWFKDNVFGIPGDEDGGGMSAWAVFTAMGFYPVTAGEPVYALSSPVFTEIAFDVPGGEFKVLAPASSKVNKYIQKAELNGKPLETPFITHEQIMSGGTLLLELGSKPNKAWGANGVYPY